VSKVDLDFQRYVERRKGHKEAEQREGAAYAYGGDLRTMRTLDALRPVKVALQAAGKLWRGASRDELLDGANKVSQSSAPEVFAGLARAAKALHVEPATVWLVQKPVAGGVHTFGSDDEPLIALSAELAARLTPDELADTLGRELGHIQNSHVAYGAARYYLRNDAARFVRWAVTPALVALDGWHKRAEITADRAGLLATRSLLHSTGAALRRAGVGEVSAEAVLAGLDEPEMLHEHPELKKRLRALKLFSESAYFRGVLGEPGGLAGGECDAKIAEVIA
jgi:hypothetical protein